MDVDEEKVSLGSAAKLDNVRWFDPYKPDPLAELSRLRVPPKGRGCLYPGATFNGTQKSGRNSYDVTVRIVNVDLEASHLCGYLNIRGLTEDWPELTTYFDAEIIGDQYGFVTGKWGATEADDSSTGRVSLPSDRSALLFPSRDCDSIISTSLSSLCDGRRSFWSLIIVSGILTERALQVSTTFV